MRVYFALRSWDVVNPDKLMFSNLSPNMDNAYSQSHIADSFGSYWHTMLLNDDIDSFALDNLELVIIGSGLDTDSYPSTLIFITQIS
jgi:hypothetical protein